MERTTTPRSALQSVMNNTQQRSGWPRCARLSIPELGSQPSDIKGTGPGIDKGLLHFVRCNSLTCERTVAALMPFLAALVRIAFKGSGGDRGNLGLRRLPRSLHTCSFQGKRAIRLAFPRRGLRRHREGTWNARLPSTPRVSATAR